MSEKLLVTLKEFIFLFAELSILFIFISTLVSALNHRYKDFFQKQLKSTSISSYFKAIFLGSITPFCSCSTIPLLSAFLKNGVSLGVCSAYLLTSPLINPIIIAMLFLSFGLKLTGAYVLFLVCSIFALSLLISKLDSSSLLLTPKPSPKFSLSPTTPLSPIKTFSPQAPKSNKGIKEYFKQSLQDYKKLLPYIALGMGIGAGIHGFVPQEFLSQTLKDYGELSLILSALLGVLLYIRVEAIIPIGVALIDVGIPSGAVMSFLIAGAGCSLPELVLLKGMFKGRFLAIFVGVVLSVAIGFGFLVQILGVGNGAI